MSNHKNEKLASALRVLRKLQDKHQGVVASKDIENEQRAILLDAGFLRQVMKGWYICANPRDSDDSDDRDGESDGGGDRDNRDDRDRDSGGDRTVWYASFWAFLSGYLSKNFGKRYCLNPEASLLIQTGSTLIPRQVVATTKEGGARTISLPFDTSLLVYPDERRVPGTRIEARGLQVYPVAEALCLVPPSFFRNDPRDAEIALGLLRDIEEVLSVLLTGKGQPAAAGRLAGALRFVGRGAEADRILSTMSRARFRVQEQNPLEIPAPSLGSARERSPYVLRIAAMWQGWRKDVLAEFPQQPGIGADAREYLGQVQERYKTDAYNSLSIEGYRVTDKLIERVASGGWDPEATPADRRDRDAMAARGYFEAFRAVKASIEKVLQGQNPGEIARVDHHDWYSALFKPAVTAGIIESKQLAGYRTGPVFIRNSMHTPLPREALLDAMEKLFGLLSSEPSAAVRAVLGHHLFVFIHPYFDGNGRIGRFLLNVMMASGGYPWTVVPMKRRAEYMAALEAASVNGSITPLARFIAKEMRTTPLTGC